ncbi:polar amino acid transport system substrate-binding protein [Amaricoccus macauensis]|uniref:Polar amino acid transport system substrate-binding protein n=1 Tax=Amaricoccus macauensis TaxID=57001 RepID=A0A840SUW4_9RHOB|nr:transporter substrate-binding domain-containing protein [Amaricoccus macauensis]MBB5222932.1 polar amino acid transport system substrate-binding protein [Amaricoccus macauensis]
MLLKTIAAGVLALALGTVAHAEDALERVKAAGVLKVGTETAFAPFDFIDAGDHAGMNIDVFGAIGEALGVKIEWVTLPWDGVLPGLESGKFDMVAGPATITKARMERYRWSVPVAEATVALLKKAGDEEITKPEDIAGKTVGSGKATAQLAQLLEFAKTLPEPIETKEYVSFNEAYADLAAGRVVAVANSFPNIAYVAQQRPETFELVEPPFGAKTYFGYPGRKDPEYKTLMDAVDAAILAMKQDGRLAEFQKKWFGITFETPDAPLTDAAF